mgnify:CR=1 FL=1
MMLAHIRQRPCLIDRRAQVGQYQALHSGFRRDLARLGGGRQDRFGENLDGGVGQGAFGPLQYCTCRSGSRATPMTPGQGTVSPLIVMTSPCDSMR